MSEHDTEVLLKRFAKTLHSMKNSYYVALLGNIPRCPFTQDIFSKE